MCNGKLTKTGNSDKNPEETKTVPGNSNNEFEKPEAPFNKFQWVGLLLAVVFAAAVSCVSIFGKENFDKYLIIMIFSITAVLFAAIFYFIYKYKISSNDSIAEDYLKDKELYRQLQRKKVEMESGDFVKKDELEDIIKSAIGKNIVNSKVFNLTLPEDTTGKLDDIAGYINKLNETIKKLETTISTKKVNINLNGTDFTKKFINDLQDSLDQVASGLK